jgi:hypothetical protein
VSKNTATEKSSGAHSLNKGHEKPSKGSGAHHSSKHEAPLRSEGTTANAKKPLVHTEDVNTHSGRPHPPAVVLPGSKILGAD